MTPEQIARAIVGESDWRQCTLASGELDFDRLRAHIADAIRLDREREAERICAFLAGENFGVGTHDVVRAVIDAIREG